MPDPNARRPLTSRSTRWAKALASGLAARKVSPNRISFGSILAAVVGSLALLAMARGTLPHWLGWTTLAVTIQLRLVCNLMDGMVAVEGGFATPTGELWNDAPDRLADTLFLASAGAACGQPVLGCLASVLAVTTAYIRTLGASLTNRHDFGGPMAKPQRMATLTLGAIGTAVGVGGLMPIALAIITAGALLTCGLRLRRLACDLNAQAGT